MLSYCEGAQVWEKATLEFFAQTGAVLFNKLLNVFTMIFILSQSDSIKRLPL
jgi:hypothetical protein